MCAEWCDCPAVEPTLIPSPTPAVSLATDGWRVALPALWLTLAVQPHHLPTRARRRGAARGCRHPAHLHRMPPLGARCPQSSVPHIRRLPASKRLRVPFPIGGSIYTRWARRISFAVAHPSTQFVVDTFRRDRLASYCFANARRPTCRQSAEQYRRILAIVSGSNVRRCTGTPHRQWEHGMSTV